MRRLRRVSVLLSWARAVAKAVESAHTRHALSLVALRAGSPFAFSWRKLARESVGNARCYLRALLRELQGLVLATLHGKAVLA